MKETPAVGFMYICCWDTVPSAVVEGTCTLGKRYRSWCTCFLYTHFPPGKCLWRYGLLHCVSGTGGRNRWRDRL